MQKEEKIENMGFWDGFQWQWNLSWRRRLFRWESEQVEDLENELQEVNLAKDMHDNPRWSFEMNGNYTIRSFLKATWDQSMVTNIVPSMWLGVAPPKAELFLWVVLQQRINTKEMLKRLNLIQASDALCPFCEKEEEIVHHLFLHCDFTWNVWTECMVWWGIQMPISSSPTF